MTRKAVVLIDGEHYIPVTKAALAWLKKETGYSLVGAAFLGGAGKIGSVDRLSELQIPVVVQEGEARSESGLLSCVEKALSTFSPDVVIDLSDEPVLNFETRMRLANLILSRGVSYHGADFLFEATKPADIAQRPSVSIIGLGKRAGKTAVATAAAKILSRKYKPVIITMGRGGPGRPELIDGSRIEITPEFLLAQADSNKHAGGDNYENALIARVPVVGCSRAGGGVAGAVFYSSVLEGAALANSLPCDFQIYQGSGTTLPPVATDARIVVAAAHQLREYITSGFASLRIKGADLVVLTGCETPPAAPRTVENVESALQSINPDVPVVRMIFRPQPLGEIRGRRIIFATTAPESVLPVLTRYIEDSYFCSVVGVASSLTDRERFRAELERLFSNSPPPELLLTELKASSVDVGVRLALSRGLTVVFCHNVIQDVEGSRISFDSETASLAEIAVKRFNARSPRVT